MINLTMVAFFLPTFVLMAIFSPRVEAALINQTDGTLHWNYDEATGLDWLDLTHTVAKSYNQVISEFSGWDVANESVWRDMWVRHYDGVLDGTVYGFSGLSLPSSGQEIARLPGIDLAASRANFVFSDFGITSNSFRDFDGDGKYDLTSISSSGLMLNDIDNDPVFTGDDTRIGGLGFSDQHMGSFYTSEPVDALLNTIDDPIIHGSFGPANSSTGDATIAGTGWFLVRAHDVTEPPVIYLLALGLVGITFIRRRRIQY
jgi:hypothetical protein